MVSTVDRRGHFRAGVEAKGLTTDRVNEFSEGGGVEKLGLSIC